MSSFPSFLTHRILPFAVIVSSLTAISEGSTRMPAAQDETLRPMTFLDAQLLARPGSWTPSPDGAWMLYTVDTVDWKEGERHSDIHLVSCSRELRPTAR
jgi:hypothetical protein